MSSASYASTQHLHSANMAPGLTWIERGPDGRPYFVRRKPKLPSARELLSNALAPLRESSPLFSRSFQRGHHVMPGPLNTPLYLPPIPAPTFPTATTLCNDQPLSKEAARAMNHVMNDHHQPGNREFNRDTPRSLLMPQPQSYSLPPPTLFPAPPQNFSRNTSK